MAKANEFFKKYDPSTQAEWYEWEDMQFFIAPLRNPVHKKELLKNFTWDQLKAIDDIGFAEAFKDDVAEVSYTKMHSINGKSLVFGWKNILDEAGNEMPFDQQLIIDKMLEDPNFGTWVQTKATELLLNRFKDKEEIVKN